MKRTVLTSLLSLFIPIMSHVCWAQTSLDTLLATYGGDMNSWKARKEQVVGTVVSATGIDAFPRGEVRETRSGYREYDGYSVENIGLEILPGVYVCGSLYMPLNHGRRIPVMLSPHGHFYNKIDKSIPNERGRYRPDQQIRCAMLARMGVAVYSYDMWAWGESGIAFKLKDHRSDLGIIMQTWQSTRIIDWFFQQSWTDRSRVGVTGASGGGTQTMIIAAIDPRIRLSVPVVMTSSTFDGGCPCESGVPIHEVAGGLRSNNAELCAAVAPRPQLIISDGDDWTKNVPTVEFPYISSIYSLYGRKAAGRVENVHLANEGHDYGVSKRAAMFEFVSRQWKLKRPDYDKGGDTWNEKHVSIEDASMLYVFGKERKLPENAVTGKENLCKLLDTYKK